MKIRREDQVMVIQGRDRGKTGKVVAVMPQTNQVLVEGINVVKRHTKPSQKTPRGGILEVTKPLNVSKVMVLDPATNLPARIGYAVKPDGSKERVFKVGLNLSGKKPKAAAKTATANSKPAAEAAPKAGEE